jgi:hypothetical protein
LGGLRRRALDATRLFTTRLACYRLDVVPLVVSHGVWSHRLLLDRGVIRRGLADEEDHDIARGDLGAGMRLVAEDHTRVLGRVD